MPYKVEYLSDIADRRAVCHVHSVADFLKRACRELRMKSEFESHKP